MDQMRNQRYWLPLKKLWGTGKQTGNQSCLLSKNAGKSSKGIYFPIVTSYIREVSEWTGHWIQYENFSLLWVAAIKVHFHRSRYGRITGIIEEYFFLFLLKNICHGHLYLLHLPHLNFGTHKKARACLQKVFGTPQDARVSLILTWNILEMLQKKTIFFNLQFYGFSCLIQSFPANLTYRWVNWSSYLG